MLDLFIDANVLLSFYGLSPNDLEELRKLSALIRQGEVTLWVPAQVRDEYERNRARVVAEALKQLRDSRLNVSPPRLSAGLPERDQLEEAVKTAQKAHSALLALLEKKAAERSLEADTVTAELFSVGQSIDTNPLVDAVRLRRDLGRPPGKGGSLGDALNWEALLTAVPHGQDLHIVSRDGDYRSSPDEKSISDYLLKEWRDHKGSLVSLYLDLGMFSSRHFPDIKLASDIPKMALIQRLAASRSFIETHEIVAELSKYDLFSDTQAALLARAAARNSQVRWIATDDDVRALLRRIIAAHRLAIDAEILSALEGSMATEEGYSLEELNDEDVQHTGNE